MKTLFKRGPGQFSYVHAEVLRAIRAQQPVRPQDMGLSGVSLEHAYMTLTRLHRKGLVARTRLTSNHTVYRLTVLGREVLDAYELLRAISAGVKLGSRGVSRRRRYSSFDSTTS